MPRASDTHTIVETSKLRPAYCLEGADQWKLDVAREAITEAVGVGNPDFAPRKVYLGEASLASALELLCEALGDLNTSPMFGPKKLVFLSGLERVIKRMRLGAAEQGSETDEEAADESPEVGSISQAIVETIQSYLRRPSPYGVVVFEAEKLDKRKALGKLLSEPKLCMLVDVGSAAEAAGWERGAEDEEAARLIAGLARELGVRLKGSALEELAASVEGDLGLARAALLKLRDYVWPKKEITSAEVAELVPEARTGIIFDLLAALAAGKRERALTLMRNLASRGEPGPKIIGGLRWVCETLLRVKELVDERREREAYRIRGFAPRAEEFLGVARQLPRPTLISWMRLLAEADWALKSSPADEEASLEVLAARLTRALERDTGARARGALASNEG